MVVEVVAVVVLIVLSVEFCVHRPDPHHPVGAKQRLGLAADHLQPAESSRVEEGLVLLFGLSFGREDDARRRMLAASPGPFCKRQLASSRSIPRRGRLPCDIHLHLCRDDIPLAS
jgi:hypothetical protein